MSLDVLLPRNCSGVVLRQTHLTVPRPQSLSALRRDRPAQANIGHQRIGISLSSDLSSLPLLTDVLFQFRPFLYGESPTKRIAERRVSSRAVTSKRQYVHDSQYGSHGLVYHSV